MIHISDRNHVVAARVAVVEGATKNLLGKPQIRSLKLLSLTNCATTIAQANPISNNKSFQEDSFRHILDYPKLFEPLRLYAPWPIAAGLME